MPNSKVSSENTSHCIILKKLMLIELNYNMSNLELLAFKLELEEWYCISSEGVEYLFIVYTDHRLEISKTPDTSPCFIAVAFLLLPDHYL